MDTSLIDRWLENGTITAEQATKMRADAKGFGAGSGLLVLAAVLNGAVLFAFTQLHGLNVGLHEILLLWLACVLPLAYGTRAKALSAACGALFVFWFVAVTFRGLDVFATLDRLPWLAPMFVLGGVTAFSLAGLHYFVPGMENVARPARIVALQGVVLGLFAMTVPRVAAGASFWNELRDLDASTQVAVCAVVAGLITVGATVTGQMFRHRAPRLTRAEAPVNVALVLLTLGFVLAPLPTDVAAGLASAVLVFLAVAVLVVGVKNQDARLVRISGFSLAGFLAFRGGLFALGRLDTIVAVALGLALLAIGAGVTAVAAKAMQSKRRAAAKPGM